MLTTRVNFADEEQSTPKTLTMPTVVTQTELGTTDTRPTTSPVSAVPTVRRYDPAMTEKALALAVQLQQEHNASLTTDEIVNIGKEVDVDPKFVLRALEAVAAEKQNGTAAGNSGSVGVVMQEQSISPRLRRLSFTDRIAAILLPLLFSLLFLFILRDPSVGIRTQSNTYVPELLLFVTAPLIAMCLGAGLRSKRLGLISGGLFGFMVTAALWIATSPIGGNQDFINRLWFTAGYTVGGAFLCFVTVLVRLHGLRLYRRLLASLVRHFPGIIEG